MTPTTLAPAGGLPPAGEQPRLLEHFADDPEFLREMVVVFRNESALLLAELRAALERGDVAGVGRAAHSLAGAIGHFSVGPALRAAARLEAIAAGGRLAGAA